MKIKITSDIPVKDAPPVGSVHDVVRTEYEPPRYKRTRIHFINYSGIEIGVFPRECEVIKSCD